VIHRLRSASLAAMLLLGSASFATAPPVLAKAGDVPISDEARRQFKAGVALLGDPAGPRYEDAYRAFKAAYAASPSPKILGNLGLCAMSLERDGEAVEAYATYLAEVADISPEQRSQIKQDLEVLQTSLVTIELEVTPPGVTVTDERVPVTGAKIVNSYELGPDRRTLGIRPGHHVMRFRSAGYEPHEWEFDAAPGERLDKRVTLEPSKGAQGGRDPAADPAKAGGPAAGNGSDVGEPSIPAAAWAMLATTLAVGAGAGIVGGLSMSNKSSFDDALAAGDRAEAESLKSTGETLNLTADVLIGTAAAAAVVTLVLFLVRPGGDSESASEASPAGDDDPRALRWQPAPLLARDVAGLALTGWF
jgi:hypothetical protein